MRVLALLGTVFAERDTAMLLGSLTLVACIACTDEQPPQTEPSMPISVVGAMMPHGDHSPAYGGQVWMHGDLHFEVVLDRAGRHRVYFSDASRVELPAAVASDVTLRVLRPDGEPEMLTLTIDEFGESWHVGGRPVEDLDTRVLVRFAYEGAPYEIDLPFIADAIDPNAPDPHEGMQMENAKEP